MNVLGLMSGTSMDGLDCCLCTVSIDKNYKFIYEIIDYHTYEYNANVVNKIDSLVGCESIDKIKSFDLKLGKLFKDYCDAFLNGRSIDIIASHGQTIIHECGIKTVQIGNPQYMYDFFNVPIVYNFRQKDIKLGGTGAPLVPFLDWLLFKKMNKNIITINIGGISNLTYVTKDGIRDNVIGFDTGPGMSLIDEYVKHIFNDIYDVDCKYSKNGKIDFEMLQFLMDNTYIEKNPPKSTTREDFGKKYLFDLIDKFKELDKYNFLRTLVRFTSSCIFLNIKKYIGLNNFDSVVLSGGGAKHQILVKDLKENLSNLQTIDSYNISIDAKEAFLMAVMGYSCYNSIPNNMPSVTGASGEHVYGQIYKR